ncbi:heme acquisition protein HasA [Aquisalimonas lutea]|uniref:heme acquisition protein HasA n=1 Tax=Aquisalimonas lutea TaxID=1327750 RepID=UPI0025B28352|nr:heme acquisition protein HasA [Aquisalimonas lutea]MDN3518490.1 heme acquisition protein HasA [Aquisalimonas lutea]
MAITITHDQATSTGGDDYLSWWEGEFVTGDHPDNTGGFYPGMFSGSQYAMSSGVAGHTAGFIASAPAGETLDYTFMDSPAHTLYGDLEKLEFGDQIGGGTSTPYSFNSGPELTVDGLDLSSGAVANNQIHEIVYGLMQGDATELENFLNTEDLTVNGSSGDDVINGYAGDDTLTGNGGDDTFLFDLYGNAGTIGDDTIEDYEIGDDVVDISAFDSYSDTVVGSDLEIEVFDASSNSQGTVTLVGIDDVNDVTIAA